jgi:hypothetical protein
MIGDGLVQPGAFIKFRYVLPPEIVRSSPQVHDPNKEVMVLHPNWNQQMHGIDLKRLTPAQVDVLRLIMDPKTKDDPAALNKYPLVKDILNRMDPPEMIKNPIAFYSMMIKPFLNRADAYRRYWRSRMMNTQVIESSKVAGQVTNPAPLFKKI